MGNERKITRKDLPGYLLEETQPIANDAWVQLKTSHYQQALDLYLKELNLYQKAENRENRSLNKGDPLHHLGICFYWMENFQESVRSFLLAYCENILSADPGQEDNEDRSPACTILRDIYLIDLTFLRRLKIYARNLKSIGDLPKNPNEILQHALKETVVDPANLLELCQATPQDLLQRSLDSIIANWPNKVFVGGAFRNPARLRDIQEIVTHLKYNPVLTNEAQSANQSVHHHNLMLLHTCRYAIFEVTYIESQLMEIERTKDYGIEPLLVCSSSDKSDASWVQVTAMLEKTGFNIHGYRDTAQLRDTIAQYLPLVG